MVIVYAGELGEQRTGDTGTGEVKGKADSNSEVYDGGRYGGKTETILHPIKGGSDHEGGNNGNKKSSKPSTPPVVVFHYDGPGNIYLPGPLVFEVQRVKAGKVVEKAKVKTEVTLKESVEKEQSNHIEDGFNSEVNQVEINRPSRPLNHSRDELQSETRELKSLFENASIQTDEIEEKNALDNLTKLVEDFNNFQKEYANLIGGSAAELSQTENKSSQASRDLSKQTQTLIKIPISNLPIDVGILERIKQISTSFLSYIFGGPSENFIGTTFKKYFDQFSNIDSNTSRGDPYVKEALKKSISSSTGGKNLIAPVREKLVKSAKSYTAPGVKIQYSQDPDKRNGLHSFDCSGFVTYIYGQMGLNFAGPYGRAPTVSDMISKNGMFHEIDASEAQVGDLVVHLKSDNPSFVNKYGNIISFSNHIGIYNGKDERGVVKESSATTRGKDAKRETNDPKFRSSIVEHPPEYLGKIWHIYKWNK